MSNLRESISVIEEEIINFKIGKITLNIFDVSEFNEFPVIDYEVLDENGKHLFSDCNVETLEDFLEELAKRIKEVKEKDV